MNESVLWWHWIVLGLGLLMLEMNTGTFLMLGLGLASIIVGILDVAIELSFVFEVMIWSILSIASLIAWKKWFKVEHVSDSGQSDSNLDTLGTALVDIGPQTRGKVTFDTPVLGNSTWTATSNTPIAKDSRVQIIDVHGQLIEVKSI